MIAFGPALAVTPFIYDIKRAREKRLAAGVALDFSAAGAWNASRLDQHDGVGMNFVRFVQRAFHRSDDVFTRDGGAIIHFLNDDQTLRSVRIDGKRRAASGTQCAVTALHGVLQILRIMIGAANDDQILQPSGDEELPVMKKSKIAGAKERPLAGSQVRAESFLRFFRLAPIAFCDTGTGNPNFTDAVGGARRKSLGVDDNYTEFRRDSSATHQ